MKRWALLDRRDRCYLGDDQGPKLLTDQMLARAGATIATEQIGRTISAVPWKQKPVRLKDEVETRCGTLEAIQRIEART